MMKNKTLLVLKVSIFKKFEKNRHLFYHTKLYIFGTNNSNYFKLKGNRRQIGARSEDLL